MYQVFHINTEYCSSFPFLSVERVPTYFVLDHKKTMTEEHKKLGRTPAKEKTGFCTSKNHSPCQSSRVKSTQQDRTLSGPRQLNPTQLTLGSSGLISSHVMWRRQKQGKRSSRCTALLLPLAGLSTTHLNYPLVLSVFSNVFSASAHVYHRGESAVEHHLLRLSVEAVALVLPINDQPSTINTRR